MNSSDREVLFGSTDNLARTRDDPAFVAALQAGMPAAFAKLHETYSRRLYKTIIRIVKNPEDAEDVLQETFLRAHLKLRTFEGRSGIYSWLTRIAINTALMTLRRRRVRSEILLDSYSDFLGGGSSLEIKDSSLNPEQTYALRQQRVRILNAIGRLKPDLQTPIRMQMLFGSSLKEIGRALKISDAAVKARLHRARSRLSTARDVAPRHQSVDLHKIATPRYELGAIEFTENSTDQAVAGAPAIQRGV